MLGEDSIDVLSLVTRRARFEDAVAAMQAAMAPDALAVTLEV
jgi:hypothetical protein